MTKDEEEKAVRLCKVSDGICDNLSEDHDPEEMYQILAIAVGMLTVRVAKSRSVIPEIMNQFSQQVSSFIEICEKHGEAGWGPPSGGGSS